MPDNRPIHNCYDNDNSNKAASIFEDPEIDVEAYKLAEHLLDVADRLELDTAAIVIWRALGIYLNNNMLFEDFLELGRTDREHFARLSRPSFGER